MIDHKMKMQVLQNLMEELEGEMKDGDFEEKTAMFGIKKPDVEIEVISEGEEDEMPKELFEEDEEDYKDVIGSRIKKMMMNKKR